MIKRLCNSCTMACPPVHVLPSRESARRPAEVYMLTQAKHDLVYPACLLGQLLLLWPARPWAKASQSLPIFPAKHDRARQPSPICPPDNSDPSRRRDPGKRQPKFTQFLGEISRLPATVCLPAPATSTH